jgi:hypothetical protein
VWIPTQCQFLAEKPSFSQKFNKTRLSRIFPLTKLLDEALAR